MGHAIIGAPRAVVVRAAVLRTDVVAALTLCVISPGDLQRRFLRPGVRSLSWGVWPWSAPPRNPAPAKQERPSLCGTAWHGVRHACLPVTPGASPCQSWSTTTMLRPAH